MTKSKAVVPAVKPRKGGAPEKVDIQKAIELRLKGVSYQDIADLFCCSKAAVIQRLKPYVATTDIDTELYVKNRAGILANKQVSVLAGLTPDKIENATAKDLAITFGVLYDKERLERGLSTQNTAVLMASAVIDADKEARAETRAKHALTGVVEVEAVEGGQGGGESE